MSWRPQTCIIIDGPDEGMVMERMDPQEELNIARTRPLRYDAAADDIMSCETEIFKYKLAGRDRNGDMLFYSQDGTMRSLLKGNWIHRDKSRPPRPQDIYWRNTHRVDVDKTVDLMLTAAKCLVSDIPEREKIAGAKYYLEQSISNIPPKTTGGTQ